MYESILANTLETLSTLPTPVPARGGLAGITDQYRAPMQPMFAQDNYHYPMGTAYLALGVTGVAEKAAASAEGASEAVQKELLDSIAQVYRGVAAYFSRYARAVYAAADGDARLMKIGDNLTALSERAPEHFDEALQLVYLMWKLRVLNQMGADIGRLDVHLRSCFEKDIASGHLSEDDVLDLLCRFYEMLNENDSGDTLINIMLGGRNADGSDAGSRLSVLMLEATKRVAMSEPHINVRVHPNLAPEIRRAMLEVQTMGQGQATLFNDEIIIPSLMRYGISEELACTYTNDGCTEVMLDGYSAIEFMHIDAVAVFELAFNNGDWARRTYREKSKYWTHRSEERFSTPDAVPGFASGRIEDCATFEEFYAQFLSQYKFQTRRLACSLRRLCEDRMAGAATSVLLNGTYDCVLESGKDILRGAFPFENYMLFAGSIPTVADCLAAVKQIVFDKKLYTVAEIKEAIRVNFEGFEVMRRQMLAAPKFGNDIDEVDCIAADIAEHFCDWLEEYRQETGFAILPSMIGWRFIDEAYAIAATPDGRRYADPIAEHYCATPGRATQGPTALLNSVGKAKSAIFKATGITPVHVTLPSKVSDSPEKTIAILDALNRSAVDKGLSFLNISIYDVDILRKAQLNPENYQDVIVRVWGFSARFVDLCPEMQEHVIRRAENAL